MTAGLPEEAAGKVLIIDPLVDPRWNQVLGAHRSDVFHSPAWLRVLASTYGFEPRAAIVRGADGETAAGVVYCELWTAGRRRIVSLPFSDFVDPLVRTVDEWVSIVDALGGPEVLEMRVLRDETSRADGRVRFTGKARWHRLDLEQGLDAAWQAMHGSGRRAIRKSERAGVEVVAASSTSDLRCFYDLHRSIRKHKYRLLAQPFGFFQSIWEQFLASERGVLLLARSGGRVVAGTMLLEWGDTLYYKFNASEASELEVFPNDALVWAAMRHVVDRELRYLDFGLSDWDQEGLIRFKSKFGSEEGRIDIKRGSAAAGAALKTTLGEITQLLTAPEVPDEVTERAGEAFYRYFA